MWRVFERHSPGSCRCDPVRPTDPGGNLAVGFEGTQEAAPARGRHPASLCDVPAATAFWDDEPTGSASHTRCFSFAIYALPSMRGAGEAPSFFHGGSSAVQHVLTVP